VNRAGLGPASPLQVRPPRPAELLWYKVAWNIVFLACRALWRIDVTGRENVPREGAYVLAPVHRSYLDTVFTAYLTRRRVRFMAKEEIFRRAWAEKLFSSLGGFPVRRGSPDREALRLCEQALANGEPLALFPEGTRRSGPVVEEVFSGAAFVALRAGVPVIPVGIGGSDRAMPPGQKLVHPGRVAVVVGKPIVPSAPGASGRVPRSAVDELTTRLRKELQTVFDQARQQVS
jgi:1-acyl-sn-glycerol-3-phosphate acyltransferase